MKRLIPLLLLFLPVVVWAQTYHMPLGKTFVCDAASRYPVTQFWQFHCRGIPLADEAGQVVGSYFLFQPHEIFINFPGFSADPYESYVTHFPNGNLPATFIFDWHAEDSDGVHHDGTAKVTWHDYVICGTGGDAYGTRLS